MIITSNTTAKIKISLRIMLELRTAAASYTPEVYDNTAVLVANEWLSDCAE